jgi:hypothetical protein
MGACTRARDGGERGIRTPGTDNRITDFESRYGGRTQTLQIGKLNVIKIATLADACASNLVKRRSGQVAAQIRHSDFDRKTALQPAGGRFQLQAPSEAVWGTAPGMSKLAGLFSSHPPVEERIAALQARAPGQV